MNMLTEQKLRQLFPNACESFIKANLGVVASGSNQELQPDDGTPLGNSNARKKSASTGRERRLFRSKKGPILRVTLVAISRGQCKDSDNLGPATKYIRDEIAAQFGLDDEDKTILWQYASILSHGQPGVIAIIESL